MGRGLYHWNEVIGERFLVSAFLGRVHAATVYQVVDLTSSKDCLLKIVESANVPGVETDQNPFAPFAAQRKIFSDLGPHEHIVGFYETGWLPGGQYLLLEYVPGDNLAKLLPKKVEERNSRPPILDLDDVRQIGLGLLDALAHMHDRPSPILHGGLKLESLVWSIDKRLVIIDFDSAHYVQEGWPAAVLGSAFPYIPPELYFDDRRPWSCAADLFSVGVILYQLLTGETPFPTRDHLRNPTPPSVYYPEIPEEVAEILTIAIQAEPNRRFAGAKEMGRSIQSRWSVSRNVEQPMHSEAKPETDLLTYLQTELETQLEMAVQAAESGQYPFAQQELARAREVAGAEPGLAALLANAETKVLAARLKDMVQAAHEGKFDEADEKLAAARASFAQDRADLAALLAEAEKKARELRRSRIEAMLGEIQTRIENPLQFDEGRIRLLLEQILKLEPGQPQAVKHQEDMPDLVATIGERKLYQETHEACKKLWEKEVELMRSETSSDDILRVCFQAALDKASIASSAHPDWSSLSGLVNEAQRRYNAARDRYEVLSTGAIQAEFKALDVLLENQDADTEVPLRGLNGESLGVMKVYQAREKVAQMGEDYAHGKSREYLEEAQKLMSAHAPRAALKELEKRSTLTYLDSESKAILEKFENEKVKPELAELEKAEHKLAQGRNTLNALDGWNLVDQATLIYPYVPDVASVRQALLPRLLKIAQDQASAAANALLEKDLEKAKPPLDKALDIANRAGDFLSSLPEAVDQAARIKSLRGRLEAFYKADDHLALSKTDPAEALINQHQAEFPDDALWALSLAASLRGQQLEKCYAAEYTIQDNLWEAADKLEELLESNPREAVSDWKLLVEHYEKEKVDLDDYDRFRSLRQRINKVDEATATLVRWNSVFSSNELPKIRETLAHADSRPKPEAATFKETLIQMHPLLEKEIQEAYVLLSVRSRYLTAKDIIERDRDLSKAKPHLEFVAEKHPSHPDSEAARKVLEDIEREIHQEDKISAAIHKAEQLLKKTPEQAGKAHALLAPYQNQPSTKKERLDKLLEKAREEWERQLVGDIERVLRSEQLTQEDVENLEKWANEIKSMLPEPKPVSVERKARARACAARAESLQGSGHWKEAAQKWLEALTYDSDNKKYREARRAARLQEVDAILHKAGSEQAEGLFEELEMELPGDIEAAMRRVRFYMERAGRQSSLSDQIQTYEQAIQVIERMEEALKRGKVEHASPSLEGEFRDLKKTVEDSQRLDREKQKICRKMGPKQTGEEMTQAKYDAEKLISEQGQIDQKRAQAVKDWWLAQVQATIADLEQADQKLGPEDKDISKDISEDISESISERIEVRSKLLVLDPSHPLSRKLINGAPLLTVKMDEVVKTFVGDRNGVSLKSANDKEALTKQVLGVEKLLQSGNNLLKLLHSLPEGTAGIQGGASLLGQHLGNLQTLWTELLALSSEVEQAGIYLSQARATNQWRNFNLILEKIGALNFAGHRSVQALRDEANTIKEQRSRFTETWQDILKLAAAEQFEDAIARVYEFEDEKTGDPTDEYGLRDTLDFREPVQIGEKPRATISHWPAFKTWLQDRSMQIKRLQRWLRGVGVNSPNLQSANTPINLEDHDVHGVAPWQSAREKILRDLDAGRFRNAREMVNQVLVGTDGWYDRPRGLLALEQAIQRLSQPPCTRAQILSTPALALFTDGQNLLAQLNPEADDARKLLDLIGRKEKSWNQAWDNFSQLITELQEVRSRRPFLPIRRQEYRRQLDESTTRANLALAECRNICPAHPNLDNIEAVIQGNPAR